MKIAQLAPFEESVPPKKYGGTELVVSNLTEGLIENNHEVVLFASGDSVTKARLFSVFPRSLRSSGKISGLKEREAYKVLGIGHILEKLSKENFDIIHNHIGWRFLPFSPLLKIPIITTLHSPPNIPYQERILKEFSSLPYVAISNYQRKRFSFLNTVATIYNGIDFKKFSFNREPKEYLAFLGRMSPEKGPVEAIRIAKGARKKLIMAAKIDISDKKFFDKEVRPLIDGKQIQFIGEVGHYKKNLLLRNAIALLAPLKWDEPFGLFMVEAMACGTPVIAFSRGSAPELVESSKTGFVVKNIEQAIRAVKEIKKIDRENCRKRVEENFTSEKMVQDYEKVYYQLISERQ